MPNNKKYQCLAVYLYYNEPWESFLSEAVLPYVKTTLQTGIATHYFFIRYWERGPHIRLRFFGEPQHLQNVLRPNLVEHFQSYFQSKPSERKGPSYAADVPDNIRWVPNNSLELVDYQPELDRYGGSTGVAIAERQFFASSQIILNTINAQAKTWTYEDALGTAIKLHLSFCHGLGMSLVEAQSFFNFFFHNWLPRSIRHLTWDEAASDQQLSRNLDQFEQLFQQQQKQLVLFHRQLWGAMEEGMDIADGGLESWRMANHDMQQQLVEAQASGFLEKRTPTHRYNFWPEAFQGEEATKERWMHFADFLHMTNNRLGILNEDEGYLGFLMMKSMEFLQ